MRTHLSIEYHVSKHNPDDIHDNFTSVEEHEYAALARLQHVSALFTLLTLLKTDYSFLAAGIREKQHENLLHALLGVGELGAAINDGMFTHVDELAEAAKQTTSVEAK